MTIDDLPRALIVRVRGKWLTFCNGRTIDGTGWTCADDASAQAADLGYLPEVRACGNAMTDPDYPACIGGI